MEINIKLNTDDLAWVSKKINSHYQRVKKSETLNKEEKQTEINILVQRALKFGLNELVDRMGFLIFDIPLSFQDNRSARLIIPKNYTSTDLKIIETHLDTLCDKNKEVSNGPGK